MSEEPVVDPSKHEPRRAVPVGIAIGAIAVSALVALLVIRAEARTNHVALAASPKPVTAVEAKSASFRPTRHYVGTIEPWVAASVGPQLVSAYVDTVLVRPGATVRRGDVLATLDCKSASAASQAVASQARAIDARQRAQASEAARYQGLLDGGFVSPNDLEMRRATVSSEEAELAAARARLVGTTLEVDDCVLRAPFDGEVATRTIDPGAFVRPGVPIVSVVDRHVVRYVADVPEADFPHVKVGIPIRIRLVSVNREVGGPISRVTPAADAQTRTLRFEVDLPDDQHAIPVGTTGEATLDVGEPIAATEIPLSAAAVRNDHASVFVVEGDVAHQRSFAVTGERDGSLFVATALPAGARVVTEGRALLKDGDRVRAKAATP